MGLKMKLKQMGKKIKGKKTDFLKNLSINQ